jgi:hypothetical protein
MANPESINYYTVDEVNALIPRLEEHLENFWGFRQNAQNILNELRKTIKDPSNLQAMEIAQQQVRQSQAHFLLEQAQKQLDHVLELGCIIKDLEIGLIDFYHITETEEDVLLCWKYGEKKIRFWHGLHEGFSHRRPLTQKVQPS